MKHYITMAATWLVANEMGLGRMNPWIGLFVLGVLCRPYIKMILKEL